MALTVDHLVRVASGHERAKLETQVPDQEEQGHAHRPPLGALVVDMGVGNRETGARQVRGSAELASNNHALDGPRGVPELAGSL